VTQEGRHGRWQRGGFGRVCERGREEMDGELR
jgi:hypothetical protein